LGGGYFSSGFKSKNGNHFGEEDKLAQVCLLKRLTKTGARFFQEALAAMPALAKDVQQGIRYLAARAAALAGTGQGKDVAALNERRRSEWRRQALVWLRADLTAWNKFLKNASP
jgi:serine/threonine-protein kinase